MIILHRRFATANMHAGGFSVIFGKSKMRKRHKTKPAVASVLVVHLHATVQAEDPTQETSGHRIHSPVQIFSAHASII